ncbi:MAG: 4-amino-4-deoxychorismate lyase [Oceanospirillaceae bacterium]|jgi:4-amino-4-deoxychorismate lyase
MSASLINGQITQKLDHADRGLSYGDGLFETIQVLNGKPLLWNAHLQRMKIGATRLKIPFDNQLSNCFAMDFKVLASGQLVDGVLKLTLTRGKGERGYKAPPDPNVTRISSLTIKSNPVREGNITPRERVQQGITICICETQLSRQPLLAGIKHLNRLEQVLARSEWHESQFSEGLVCDTQGFLVEACMSNVFWIKEDVLYTPQLSFAGVEGVIRNAIIEICTQDHLINIEQGYYKIEQLFDAQEVFICNSVFDIKPVSKICIEQESSNYIEFNIGSMTKLLQIKLQQYYLKET